MGSLPDADRSAKPPPASAARVFAGSALLFLTACSLYCLTLTENDLGYEAETQRQARSFLNRERPIHGRAGLLDVVLYVPFVALDQYCSRRGWFPSFEGFTSNFALPFQSALIALIVFWTAIEVWRFRTGLALAMVYAWATMAWPYSKMGMETGLTFATAIAFWGLVREAEHPDRGGYLLLALGLALMLLTKVHGPLVVLMFIVSVLMMWRAWQLRRPGALESITVASLLVLGVCLYFWGNVVHHERWLFNPSYGFADELRAPRSYFWNALGLLISPGKGLVFYNPPLLLGLLGFGRFIRWRRWYLWPLGLVVLPQILFHAYFRTWADETWGPRRLLNLLPVLILPVGVVFEGVPVGRMTRRMLNWGLIGAGVTLQLLAVSMNYAAYTRALTPAGLASEQNFAWNPGLTHYRFQAWLFASSVSRWRGEGSLALTIGPEYLDWNAPPEPPPSIRLDLSPFDERLDVWWAARAARDPQWLRSDNKSVYLLAGMIFLGLVGLLGLGLCLRERAAPVAPPPVAESQAGATLRH